MKRLARSNRLVAESDTSRQKFKVLNAFLGGDLPEIEPALTIPCGTHVDVKI
jgi:hypothetical protein